MLANSKKQTVLFVILLFYFTNKLSYHIIDHQEYVEELIHPGFITSMLVAYTVDGDDGNAAPITIVDIFHRIMFHKITFWMIHITVLFSIPYRWYLNKVCHTAINIRNLTLAMKCNIHTSLSNKTNVKVGRFAYAYHDIDRNDPMYFVKVFSPLALLAFLATIVLIILVFANVL